MIESPVSTVSSVLIAKSAPVAEPPSVNDSALPVPAKFKSFTGVTFTVAVTSVTSTNPPESVIVSMVNAREAFVGSSLLLENVIPSNKVSIFAAVCPAWLIVNTVPLPDTV